MSTTIAPNPSALTDEQTDFVAAIRDFCEREVGTREQRDALTHHGKHPHVPELYAKVAELGWLGIAIGEEYGGIGGSMVDLMLFLEETARGMLPIGGFAVSMISAGAIERFGTDDQKQEILGGIANGNVESIAMSEPGSGSDVGSLTCRAEKVPGGWKVNGQKTWISEAQFASHILLVCRTTPGGKKHEGLTMLSVPVPTEGVEIRGIETMGGEVVNDVFFTDVFVPESALIGQEDQAWMQLMAGLNLERLIIAGLSLGAAQRSFDDALTYIKEREQFGRPIGSFQALKHRVADLATELECTRLLTYDVARKVDANPGALWFICPLLLYWVLRIWFLAKRGELEGDPVAFAIRDRNSLLTCAVTALLFSIASRWRP